MLFVTYNADSGVLISVTDSPPIPDLTQMTRVINVDSVDISAWDTKTRTFNQEINHTSSKITKLAFRQRFTMQEKVMLELASKDNPASPMQTRQMAATLKVYLEDVNSATYVDLKREDTRQGVLLLEQFGIIGVGRALVILDSPINNTEIYKE